MANIFDQIRSQIDLNALFSDLPQPADVTNVVTPPVTYKEADLYPKRGAYVWWFIIGGALMAFYLWRRGSK